MTLIELLIAISIASTLAVAGYRALAALTSSAEQLTQTTQRWQALDAHANAIERAYRRIAPASRFVLTTDRLDVIALSADGVAQLLQFGALDETVVQWRFSIWDGFTWASSWNDTRVPLGLKVNMVTAQGELVERIYAR